MDNVGAHTDPQRLLAVPGSQSADAQITKLSEGYAAWSEELVASSTSALDETIGSAAFAQLYASVAKAQGDTEISAVGHGRRIVGDTGNVLHGRIATKEHMAAAQNVRFGSSPVPTHDPDLRSRPFERI